MVGVLLENLQPAGPRVGDRPLEDSRVGIGYGEPGLDSFGLKSPQPRIVEDGLHRRAVSSADERIDATELGQQDPCGVVGSGFVGNPGLVVPPPGETLLALPARLGPALHVPPADLAQCRRTRRPGGDREASLAHQEEAPSRLGASRGGELLHGGAVEEPAERQRGLYPGSVLRQGNQATDGAQPVGAVPSLEVLEPAREAGGWDLDGGHKQNLGHKLTRDTPPIPGIRTCDTDH